MLTPPYKILIVDDEPEICELIKDILESEFGDLLSIQTCTNLSKAFYILDKEDIRIILSDFYLKGETGDTLLQKAQAMHNGIRFIMLTGDINFQNVFSSFLDGAVSIVTKPFKPEELIDAITICLRRLEYWNRIFKEVEHHG